MAIVAIWICRSHVVAETSRPPTATSALPYTAMAESSVMDTAAAVAGDVNRPVVHCPIVGAMVIGSTQHIWFASHFQPKQKPVVHHVTMSLDSTTQHLVITPQRGPKNTKGKKKIARSPYGPYGSVLVAVDFSDDHPKPFQPHQLELPDGQVYNVPFDSLTPTRCGRGVKRTVFDQRRAGVPEHPERFRAGPVRVADQRAINGAKQVASSVFVAHHKAVEAWRTNRTEIRALEAELDGKPQSDIARWRKRWQAVVAAHLAAYRAVVVEGVVAKRYHEAALRGATLDLSKPLGGGVHDDPTIRRIWSQISRVDQQFALRRSAPEVVEHEQACTKDLMNAVNVRLRICSRL